MEALEGAESHQPITTPGGWRDHRLRSDLDGPVHLKSGHPPAGSTRTLAPGLGRSNLRGHPPAPTGASTSLAIGFRFPASSVAGNKADDGPLSASFDVLLVIDGDTPPVTPGPSTGPSTGPNLGGLGVTGVGAVSTLILAAGVVAAGMLLLLARRGREARREPR